MQCESTASSDLPLPSGSQTILSSMPMMIFEKHLITPFTDSIINTDRRRIEIPIFFGAPMKILREKHEVELSSGHSFIEAETPPRVFVDALVDKLLINCTTAEDIESILWHIKPVIIFHAILELLRRIPGPIFPLSSKGAQIASKVVLLEPVHPYEFLIQDELYREILTQQTEHGDDSSSRFKRSKQKTIDTIQPLIQKYYHCNDITRQKATKMLNKFNKSIYHDLHLITDKYQRNLVRFIIRNIIYLTRRYKISYFRRLCQERGERWSIGRVTIQPHIREYSYIRMAEMVGPLLIGQPDGLEHYADLEKRVMLNILACGTDRMWLPNRKPHEILVNTELSYCHANCVCGRGLNVISAQSRKVR